MLLLEKVQISSALAVLQTPTEPSKATANMDPSFENVEASGVRERREIEVRQCQAEAEYDQSLIEESREVVRRRGWTGEGEKVREVRGRE